MQSDTDATEPEIRQIAFFFLLTKGRRHGWSKVRGGYFLPGLEKDKERLRRGADLLE